MKCSVDGCDLASKARGLCWRHYEALPRPLPCVVQGCGRVSVTVMGRCEVHGSPTCSVDGCDRARHSRGLCKPHYRAHQSTPRLRADLPTGTKPYTRPRKHTECLTCVDARWLAEAGVIPSEIATRLGFRGLAPANHLRDHLRMHGQSDLLDRIALHEEDGMQADDLTVPPVLPLPAEVTQAARECLTRRCPGDADILADMLGIIA